MKEQRLEELFSLYISREINEKDERELMLLLNDPELQNKKGELIESLYDNLPSTYILSGKQAENIFNDIINKPVAPTHRMPVSYNRWWWAAASILIILSIVYIVRKSPGTAPDNTTVAQVTNDVKAPLHNRATITLSTGKLVYLDSANSGQLATQGNVNVIKTADGNVVYTGNGTELAYNTLYNPRGSKVQPLTLSDGTKVWLNSESSLRFPAAFTGTERKVEITGEAYFEVAKDATKKFMVTGNGVITEVVGTHFNVNSYNDESSVKVTLLEGSVKVSKGSNTGLLKPGQQADIDNDIKILKDVNTDEAIAWKDGFFYFESADLKTIFRQYARWYDIEVVYKGTVSNEKYFSIMNRNNSLASVLKSLQTNGVKFTIENKKLLIE